MPKKQTLALLKPDCFEQKLIGRVLTHLEQTGFTIMAARVLCLDRRSAERFYAVHKRKDFFSDLVAFMTSGRIMPLLLERENAVEHLRKVVGATDPAEAEDGTIRKLYGTSKQNNIIHASDSEENAKKEIHFFFSEYEYIFSLGT